MNSYSCHIFSTAKVIFGDQYADYPHQASQSTSSQVHYDVYLGIRATPTGSVFLRQGVHIRDDHLEAFAPNCKVHHDVHEMTLENAMEILLVMRSRPKKKKRAVWSVLRSRVASICVTRDGKLCKF
jgi:ketosteroid isomerase-like protein